MRLLAAIAALAVADSGSGREIVEPDETRIALQFKDAEIASVVEAVAVAVGERFLFDDRLQGRVTIAVLDRVTVPEALEILNAALLMKGFVAVPSAEGFRKIVPIQNTATDAPWTLEQPRRERGGVVTTLTRIQFANAGGILDALRPMLSATMLARVYTPTNSLILAGTEARLHRLLIVVQALDRAQERHQTVLRLRYRSAAEVLELIEGVFEPQSGPRRFKLVADERTNALIVEASSAQLDEIRAFVRDVDRPAEGAGGLHVIAVKATDAERLAELVRAATSEPGPRERGTGALTSRDYTIAVDPPTNSLLIRAAPETFRMLADLIRELDQVPPIVSIEALVVEVSTSRALRLALDAVVPLGADPGEGGTSATIVQNTSGTPIGQPNEETVFKLSRAPLVIPVITPDGETIAVEVPGDNLVVLARERQIYTRVLLNPHLLAMSGDEHQIRVGDNIPIPVSRVDDQATANPLTVQQNIERRDVGVILHVSPTVGVEGGVQLDFRLEVSRLAPSLAGDVERVGPTIRQRTIEASFTLQDGQLAVIGAHVQPRFIEIEKRVPFLGEIPFLGVFFRSTTDEALDTHLVIAVQARLLRTPAEEAAESIRRRLAFQRHLTGLEALQEATEAPYALLATTRTLLSDAEAIAETLASPDGRAKVIPWETYDGPRYDVYLTGFHELSELGNASLALRDLGWAPSVVVVPATLPR